MSFYQQNRGGSNAMTRSVLGFILKPQGTHPSLTLKSDNTSTTSVFYDKQIDKGQVLFVVLLIIKRKNIKILLNLKKKLIKNI